jgi:hypothetical protein
MKMRTRAWTRRLLACGVLALVAIAHSAFAFQQDNQLAARMALASTFFMVAFVFFLAFYVYGAICLQTIAQKTNTPNGWLAWIPIANIVLMLNIARKPLWWIVLCLIPVVNLVMVVNIWMAIAKVRNKPEWWGILTIVPVVNLIVPGYLAFSSDGARNSPALTPAPGVVGPIEAGQATPGAGSWSLYCVSGEFAHDTVEIPSAGLYIGRDPSKANLVLSSHEVSSVHVYVRPEPGGSQTWVEDWNSLNGTYYQPGAQSPSQWVQLKGKILLSRGARFRLGDNIAEFEIRAS